MKVRSVLAGVMLLALLLTIQFVVPAASQQPPPAVPEGKILFDSDAPTPGADRNVWVVNPDGSGGVNLTEIEPAGDVDAAFSPDATTVVFSSCRTESPVVENLNCSLLAQASPDLSDSNIHVMKSDGTGVVPLTTTTQSPTNDGDADIYKNDNGVRIAFVSFRDGNSEIYIMNGDGTGQTRLTTDLLVSPISDLGPAFSPDGEQIAFSRGGDIWVMRKDGSARRSLTSGPADDRDPSWSPDGSRIAFSRDRGIYTLGANGGTPAAVIAPGLLESTTYKQPAFSPDGQWIAFSSNRDGDFDIYRIAPNGSGSPIAITNNAADDDSPDWVENFQVNVEQLSVPASPGSIPLSAIPLQPGAPNADPATAPIKIEELG
ncbi:MAG TPA: hypothetical protein VND22_02130, partial [Actinomycetota bacterium]|nr:hypothetical protein [Actinomycetota bacterium]